MKHLKISILLMFLILPVAANAQTSKMDSKIESLITAIVKKHPGSSRSYRMIEIGSTGYLIRGNSAKILKTRKGSGSGSGMCGGGIYAYVHMYMSNLKMEDLSEGEGAIWKFDGKVWKETATPDGGVWLCRDVKNIPQAAKKCLEITECY